MSYKFRYRIKCVTTREETFYIETDDYSVSGSTEKYLTLHYLLGWNYLSTDPLKICLLVEMREHYSILIPGDSSPAEGYQPGVVPRSKVEEMKSNIKEFSDGRKD